MKRLSLTIGLGLTAIILLSPARARAQAELTGTYIDYVGVGANGGMINAAGHSMRYRETAGGSLTGDAFYPGSPYYSILLEATDSANFVARNLYGYTPDFATMSGPTVSGRSILWTGRYLSGGRDVTLVLEYTYQVDDRWVIINATVTNNSGSALTDVYLEFIDEPDFAVDIGGDYSTYNDVLRQPPGHTSALRTNRVTAPWPIGFGAGSIDPRARVSSTVNSQDADPSTTWTTPTDDGGALADNWAAIVFKQPSLAAGASTVFTWAYVWGPDDATIASRFDSIWTTSPCGNGVLDVGEECDDGPGNSDVTPDACRTDCTLPACGDAVVDTGETCDDANTVPGDGCRPDCSIEACGDAILDPGEQCDDGAGNSDTIPDACRTDCTLSACGDAVLDTGEACDDGNTAPGDGCRPNCTLEVCGDGILDVGEQCDDGAGNSDTLPDACRTGCELPWCGDGVTDSLEDCDDANAAAGDGCRPDCSAEVCGDGIQDAGEECDDGPGNSDTNPDACRTSCELPWCGDAVADTGEQCDDGNLVDGDACKTGCLLAVCGDGIVGSGVELCDDGNLADADGCSATCAVEAGFLCTGDPSVCCEDGDEDGACDEDGDDGESVGVCSCRLGSRGGHGGGGAGLALLALLCAAVLLPGRRRR